MRTSATDAEGAHASHLSPVAAHETAGRNAVLLSSKLWEIVLEERESRRNGGKPTEVLVAIQSRYAGVSQRGGPSRSLIVWARKAEDAILTQSIKVRPLCSSWEHCIADRPCCDRVRKSWSAPSLSQRLCSILIAHFLVALALCPRFPLSPRSPSLSSRLRYPLYRSSSSLSTRRRTESPCRTRNGWKNRLRRSAEYYEKGRQFELARKTQRGKGGEHCDGRWR